METLSAAVLVLWFRGAGLALPMPSWEVCMRERALIRNGRAWCVSQTPEPPAKRDRCNFYFERGEERGYVCSDGGFPPHPGDPTDE